MSDFTKPALNSTYTNFITELKFRDEVVGSLYSTDVAVTGLPADNSTDWGVRSIRWNATNSYFERRNAANNGWERLEGNTGTHKFVNLEAGTITGSGTVSGTTISASGQVQGGRINVTGSTRPANGLYLPSTNTVRFSTASGDRLTILNDGKTGIGTTNPNQKLEVVGAARIQNGSGASFLEIGAGGSGNRFAYIDLVGDGTHTDFGTRLMRQNSGANAISELVHKGSGNFHLEAADTANILLRTQATTRMCIRSNGNIGIGNFTDPAANLHFKNTTTDPNYIIFQNSQGSQYIRGDNDRLYLDADLFEFRTEAGTRVAGIHEDGFTVGGDPNSSIVKFEVKSSGNSYSDPSNNNVASAYIYNSNAASNSHAILALRTNSASGGDPFISLDVNGVAGWHVGVDNSDHDTFKIGTNWNAVGNDTALAITRSKDATFSGSVTATSFSGNGSGLTAVNATSVDGIDSGSFLRSDANDTATGVINFSGKKIGLGTTPASTFGSRNAALCLGDNDTGIAQNGDGQLELWANNTEVINIDATQAIFYGNAVPNGTRNLGSTGNPWANLYINDLNMSNKGKQNDVDGTWGDYTIQEGENDLFIKNNRNGKIYKMNWTEVEM